MLVVARASKPMCASSRADPMSHGLGIMKACLRWCSARKAAPFSACVGMDNLLAVLWGREAERGFHSLHKISFFAQDQALVLRHGKILLRFGIGFQSGLVSLISRQAVKGNQSPGNVVSAFIGKKISYKLPATSGNDAAPVFRVLPELLFLKGINLIADHASHCHLGSSTVQYGTGETSTLRLSSNYECRTAARRRSLTHCGRHRRPGALPHALLPL